MIFNAVSDITHPQLCLHVHQCWHSTLHQRYPLPYKLSSFCPLYILRTPNWEFQSTAPDASSKSITGELIFFFYIYIKTHVVYKSWKCLIDNQEITSKDKPGFPNKTVMTSYQVHEPQQWYSVTIVTQPIIFQHTQKTSHHHTHGLPSPAGAWQVVQELSGSSLSITQEEMNIERKKS